MAGSGERGGWVPTRPTIRVHVARSLLIANQFVFIKMHRTTAVRKSATDTDTADDTWSPVVRSVAPSAFGRHVPKRRKINSDRPPPLPIPACPTGRLQTQALFNLLSTPPAHHLRP